MGCSIGKDLGPHSSQHVHTYRYLHKSPRSAWIDSEEPESQVRTMSTYLDPLGGDESVELWHTTTYSTRNSSATSPAQPQPNYSMFCVTHSSTTATTPVSHHRYSSSNGSTNNTAVTNNTTQDIHQLFHKIDSRSSNSSSSTTSSSSSSSAASIASAIHIPMSSCRAVDCNKQQQPQRAGSPHPLSRHRIKPRTRKMPQV